VLETVVAFLQDHWIEGVVSVASLVVGGMLGRWQAWVGFSRRVFFDRITVSLTFVEDGELCIRTLLERNAAEVFRNGHMLRRVMAAARKRSEDALLPLPLPEYWFYLNAVLNVISEQFAQGYVREEAGLPVETQTYLLALTCERDRKVRQTKVRAMLVREELLRSMDQVQPTFKNEFHAGRWATLQRVRDEWIRTEGTTERIRRIVISV
jgi:hypothetical protein